MIIIFCLTLCGRVAEKDDEHSTLALAIDGRDAPGQVERAMEQDRGRKRAVERTLVSPEPAR